MNLKMDDNTTNILFVFMVLFLFFLFGGEPDIHDRMRGVSCSAEPG